MMWYVILKNFDRLYADLIYPWFSEVLSIMSKENVFQIWAIQTGRCMMFHRQVNITAQLSLNLKYALATTNVHALGAKRKKKNFQHNFKCVCLSFHSPANVLHIFISLKFHNCSVHNYFHTFKSFKQVLKVPLFNAQQQVLVSRVLANGHYKWMMK